MKILMSVLLVVVLAALGWSAYRAIYTPPDPGKAFRAIQSLDPGELEMHCGVPQNEMLGVVADGAGIRDLRYQDSAHQEIVIRFISDDDKTWKSLGAWERVNPLDQVGTPVDPVQAGERLRCVTKESAATKLVQPGQLSGGWAESLAIAAPQAMGEMLMPGRQQGPPPMPNSMPNSRPLSGGSGGGSSDGQLGQHVIEVPSTGWYAPPRVAMNWGDDDDLPRVHAAPKCPAGAEPCAFVGSAAFADWLKQAIQAERNDQFEPVMNKLLQRKSIMVELPTRELDRAAAIRNLVPLEVRAINIAAEKLADDEAKLEPKPADPDQMKAQKLAAMERQDTIRRKLWSYAVRSTRPDATVIDHGGTLRFNTLAYVRMMQIHTSGMWP